jgi:transposase
MGHGPEGGGKVDIDGQSPPGRKRAAAGPSGGREAQEDALETAAQRQPGARRAKRRLYGLLQSKLATGRAWMLKETFQDFWRYRSLTWASAFLDVWTTRALRSRLEPMKKVARMLRSHDDLLMNRFKAKGEISAGAVEGLNNKIRVVTRRSYGFRTYDAMEIALYHTLGRLPEPEEFTHRFC